MDLKEKVREIKLKVLHMCVNAGTGHVTSAFSCAEIMVALYYAVMRVDPKEPAWKERDRFVMSKNHGSVVTFPVLEDLGFFSDKCKTFLENGSVFGPHAKLEIPGVEFSGGSLGIGLGAACGIAYSAKADGDKWLTFCLVGDGECYEGSIWEAAMFAGHNELNNLIVIVDRNQLCMTGQTEKLLRQESVVEKWKAFNWEVREVDGHDVEAVVNVLSDIRVRESSQPLCVIAHTIKGKGIDFMESNPYFHGLAPLGEQAENAIRQVERG